MTITPVEKYNQISKKTKEAREKMLKCEEELSKLYSEINTNLLDMSGMLERGEVAVKGDKNYQISCRKDPTSGRLIIALVEPVSFVAYPVKLDELEVIDVDKETAN